MTVIRTEDGKPVLRDGKVGTGAGCCCEGCPRCIRNGEWDCQYTTKESCEECVRVRKCLEVLQTKCDGTCPNGGTPPPASITITGKYDSCFSWTQATGTAAIGCGKVISASVTDGGGGFARVGRTAPTLTASVEQGGVTLDFSGAECGSGASGTVAIAGGVIVSASVTNGGSGYAKVAHIAPTLTASAPGGTGGVLSINGYAKIVGGLFDGYYVPTGITVVSGGSGYTDNAQVTLSLGTDDEWAPGSGAPDIRIRTAIDQPADEWTLTPYSSNGSGLVVSLTLALVDFGEEGYAPGYGPIYEATTATVVNGGTGYEVGTEINVEGSTTVEGSPTVVVVSSVDGSGAVTGLDVLFGGYHEGTDTGVISSVVITSGRPARKRTIEVCDVPVAIVQSPATGSGAEITATVEDDESDPNFGKIIGLTVVDGGSGYSAGSGGELSVSLEQFPDTCGFDAWRVASIEVTAPGTGYQAGDTVKITAASGDTTVSTASATIEVDEDGGITAAPIGKWWDGWQVRYASGEYYRESKEATPYVASLTVTVNATQQPPAFGGVPAELTASVDTNPNSQTFGSVTSIAVNKDGAGYVALCESTRGVSDCTECPPRQQPELSSCYVESQTGVCGDWQSGFPCVEPPCCDSCLPECSVNINVIESTGDYLKQSYGQTPENDIFIETIPWVDAFLQSIAGFNCTLIWVYDTVVQTNATGEPCGSLNGVPQKAIRSWYRYRLFLIDCRTRTIREVTDEAFSEELTYTICTYPGFPVPLCDLPFCNDNPNPGFLDAAPTLVCP